MNRNTYIWGAGHCGTLTALDFEKKDLKVKGFIDANATQIKTRLGLPVLKPCDILSENSNKPFVVIAVQNKNAIREITKQLEDAEFKLHENFEFSNFIEYNFGASGNKKYYDDERLYNTPSKTFAGYNSINMELFGQYVNFVEIEVFCKNIFMQPETYSKIIDELMNVSFSGSICINTNNEPLVDNVILERLQEAKEKLPEATLNTFANVNFVTKEYPNEFVNETFRETPCSSPFTNIYIGYDGSVTPCRHVRHDIPQNKDMVMGNVNEQLLYDIYAGYKFSQLRYQMRDHGLNKVFPCSICNDYYYPMPSIEETCQWNCRINNSKQYCSEILPQLRILHKQTFGDFRGAFDGKDVVICGAGPTLNYYESIEGAIHIAVNRALLFNKVMFDYFFVCDYRGIKPFMESIVAYKGNNCIKFIGNDSVNLIPDEYFNGIENIRKFFTDGNVRLWRPIPIHIDENPLWNSNTISIIALQFALFGRARRIYLSGCDTYSQLYRNTHFVYAETETPEHMNKFLNDTQKEMYRNTKIKNYHHIRDFRNLHYPDTEIVSVNPVGLKGLFDEDIYTDSYLKTLGTEV